MKILFLIKVIKMEETDCVQFVLYIQMLHLSAKSVESLMFSEFRYTSFNSSLRLYKLSVGQQSCRHHKVSSPLEA